MTIIHFNRESPGCFRFEIQDASIRHDKFFGVVVELERNIGRNYSKGQFIAIGVRGDDIPNCLAARPIRSIGILFRNRKGLVGNDRVSVFFFYLDRNRKLV